MSALGKKWIVKNSDDQTQTIEKLLKNRNLILEDPALHNPFLFTDMKKAVDRILLAIANQQRIIIFGDYDVDGITSTAILFHTLKKLNATASYRLPNREKDGYGLSEKFIDEFNEKEIQLLITVDCGISCFNEIEKANEYGIDTIITDHHTIPEKPPNACAIIHPKLDKNYPYKELTGAGVAFKLAQALIHETTKDNEFVDSLIDLAAMGTVADLGPLNGENRTIVKMGLAALAQTKWHGLKKIMDLAEVKEKVNTTTIGYQIAPRINAAGRIGDPYIALTLLLQEEENEKVHQLGQKLEDLNIRRQDLTRIAIDEVEQMLPTPLPLILIFENPNWHVGILGLIASKLVEKYGRPAIVMQDLGEVLVASARSPQNFNIVEALSASKDHLLSFGGHAQAAGFNLAKESLPNFKNSISAFTQDQLKDTDLTPTLEIDCEVKHEEINFGLLSEIEKMAPFGVANSKPALLLSNLEPIFVDQIGKEGRHLKFSVKINEDNVKVIAFNMGDLVHDLRKHRKIDLVCNIERNHWNNKDYLQLRALDFRPHSQ